MNNSVNVVDNYKRRSYVNETADSKRDGIRKKRSAEQKGKTPDDRVSLSETSREMEAAKLAAASTPESTDEIDRVEKVKQIKQAVNDGSYHVDAEQVAEKLIGAIIDSFG